ncbi:Uncharacterized membrane protein YoaK, UPF0700 family [Chitinophaga sp. YR627]|uniref:YoaK family protein n=1 Tax=Chitinophaga sp. YR627 TaxID=1881041 RepID=UPI0008E56216|nr:YoaK family protein [Chitinophaga sp. YR627]SFM89366.1 Uncharacterized membrane protein YoaK, UPF0700 family [Chitinophaga sp. YR627]
MFRYRRQKRSFRQNIRLAILLCTTAGFVNASGFLGFFILTTNLTGHAVLLAVKLTEGDFRAVRMIGLWLLLFLSGAFFCSLYVLMAGRDKRHSYTIPIIIEIVIFYFVGYFGHTFDHTTVKTEYFAGSLLFAMGMQNALVSVISGAVVRTTHLTGMFTDLGVDLSAALLKYPRKDALLQKKIVLRLVIILFFLTGGILGGFAFIKFQYHSFYIAIGILLTAICYDFFRVNSRRIISRLNKK